MKQLALRISPPPEPSLENFVPGSNEELLARLRALREGAPGEGICYIWGEPGTGKSHLLAASERAGLVLADDVHKLDDAAQIALFNAINEAREAGGAVLAAGNAPPAQLDLRDDLKSRLAWGLVYQLRGLTDEERSTYLSGEAARRGMHLPDEVIAWLLARIRRDMRSLNTVLDRIDQVSLELKRPITLPLVRDAIRAQDQAP